ncbi:AAA family ATPase, partial [bacterium]|nr:AAA family ATPase [bacterium]
MVIRTGDRVLRSKFVDRKKEMSELKKNVEDVIKGKGNLVFIEGEAGVGKTRLIEELKAWVKGNQQDVQFLSGKCIFREGSEPYLPFTDALREYHERNLKVELIGVVPENGEPLEQFSIEMIPLLEPATSVSKASETKSIIGEELLIGDEAPELDGTDKGREELRATEISETSMPIGFIPTIIKSTDAETLKLEQDKMFEIISNQLINLSKSGPVILFLDDLQWADDATLRLLHYIAEKTGDSPILIYGVYRPEELQLSEEYQQPHPLADTIRRLSREKIFKKIKLERLPFNATESMIKIILSRDEIPKEFSDWLFKKTEGNPFFIEEVILSFIEEGLIDPKAYLWPTELDLSQLSKIKIPMTIGDLIIRRLDRLDSNDLKILSYAALIGREFDYDVLKDLSGFEEDKLLDSLDRLINSGLIHEDFTTEDEERYKFDNVMIQDIAYSGLSRVRRRLMHRKVAEIIEDTNRTKIGMVIYELAHHHYEGKVWNKAVYYLIKAAEKASSLYALSEAIY